MTCKSARYDPSDGSSSFLQLDVTAENSETFSLQILYSVENDSLAR